MRNGSTKYKTLQVQAKLKKQKTQRTPKELEVEVAEEEEEEEEGVVEEAAVAVDVAENLREETQRHRRNPAVHWTK